MAERCISRRGALTCAAASLAAVGVGAAPAGAHGEGLPDEPYVAWPGYASTAPGSVLPGCVPVAAPTAGEVAWRSSEPARGGLALLQVGGATRAYALEEGSLVALDMASGEAVARASLPVPAPPRARMAVLDSALAVPLSDGTVALYSEDLEPLCASAPAGDGAAWGSASLATDGTVLYASFCDGARARVASCSGYDAGVLWTRDLEVPGGCAGLELIALEDGVLVCDGGPVVRALSSHDGSDAASFDAGAPVGCRVAALYGGAARSGRMPRFAEGALVATAEGRISLVSAAGLAELSRVDLARPLADRAPVAAARGGVWTEDGTFVAVDALCDGEAASLALGGEVPAAVPVTAGVACCRGASPRDAAATVYAFVSGGLQAIERDADGGLACGVVCEGDAGAGADVPCPAPLVDRDGSVVVPSASGVVALRPDASRAVPTDVGGHEGLDTVGHALAGVQLPNGAGLGAGVLVFGVTFAAYALIRNRGGARDRDEGLEEWRAEHGRGRDGGDGGSRGR